MKKAILILCLLPPFAAADYVSPSEYKGFTCDELKVELEGLNAALISKLRERIDARWGSVARATLDAEYRRMDARRDAIRAAAERISCDLNEKLVVNQ